MWKDYRMNRLIVFLAVFLVVLPHVICLIVSIYKTIHYGQKFAPFSVYLCENLMASSMVSLLISLIVFAFIGGNAIAGERADRSAEFLAYLPISRGRIITSKLLVVFFVIAFIWLVNFSILGICASVIFQQIDPTPARNFLQTITEGMASHLILGLTLFAIAWFCSSFLESPTFSICLGLLTPLFLAALWFTGNHVQERTLLTWLFGVYITLALICFPAGTWYYLRRVEP